ncbi:hypothetical protein PR048_003962, partial [Dryococelus australis]
MGPAYAQYVSHKPLKIHAPTTFTCQKPNATHFSLLDFFISTSDISINNIHVNYSGTSDHFPVVGLLDSCYHSSPPLPKFNFQKTNWELFQNMLSESIDLSISQNNSQFIDNQIETLTSAIHTASNIAIPKHIPPLINGNEIHESTSQKAEKLARHFKATYAQPNLPCALSQPPNPRPKLVTLGELTFILTKTLTTSTASGNDNIPNTILIHLPRKAIIILTRIYNAAIVYPHFRTNWKRAIREPIAKPNKNPS